MPPQADPGATSDYCSKRHAPRRPSDSIALITYDTTVQIVLPARPTTAETLAKLRTSLAGLHTGSSTNLEGGWLAGADAAASAGLPRMRALLVTDGLANVGETHPIALCRHARELRERGLFTSTIGVGADFNEVLLLQIAEYGGGNFHFVDEPEQFEPVLARELGEALAPFAEEISVHVTVRPRAECHVLGEKLVHPADDGWIVRVGSLAAGRTTDLVVRVDPPLAVISDTGHHTAARGRQSNRQPSQFAARRIPPSPSYLKILCATDVSRLL